jgi:hypothetical protein
MHILHRETVIELPATSIIIPAARPIAGSGASFGGNEVRGILYDNDVDMNIIQDTGWMPNAWTTWGQEHLYTKCSYAMSIGTGVGATTDGMGDLVNQVHQAQSSHYSAGNNGAAAYDFWQIYDHRYNPGEGTGLITEVGVHTALNSAGTMAARSLLGTPIDKQAANVLDMFYRTNCTPDLTDKTGSVLVKGVNYDYTVRPYDVSFYEYAWNGIGPANTFSASTDPLNTNVWDAKPTAGGPSNTMSIIDSVVDGAAKSRSWTTIAYLTTCNFNIKCCFSRLSYGRLIGTEGGIGVGFVATDGPDIGGGIPKDNTEYFSVGWVATWTYV